MKIKMILASIAMMVATTALVAQNSTTTAPAKAEKTECCKKDGKCSGKSECKDKKTEGCCKGKKADCPKAKASEKK